MKTYNSDSKKTNRSFLFIVFTVAVVFSIDAVALGNKRPPAEPTSPSQPKPPSAPAPNPPTATQPPTGGSDYSNNLKNVIPLWENHTSQGKNWTEFMHRELDQSGKNLLDVIPGDQNLFCPNYSNLSLQQRKAYWVFMVSSMARFESNFKPAMSYTEGFNDSQGQPVISRGLLQLSIESGNAYGCQFKSAQEVHDPLKNLRCGIKILDRWLSRDGRIAGKVSGQWRGGARYWSVLREGDKTSYKSILSWSQNLSICKK